MFKLMKLESKKHKLAGYLPAVMICIVLIFAVVGLMGWGSRNEVETMFPDYQAFMSLADIFIRTVFLIFAGVILSRIVIEEYRTGTIQLLFTYPIQRKKLMKAKLIIVFAFCFSSIVFATVVTNILVYLISPHVYLFEAPVTWNDMMSAFPMTLVNALMTAGVSLIPLFFGMRKKSTAATITWAVLIGVLINGTVSNGDSTTSLFQFIWVPIALCIFGLAIAYFSYHQIDKRDIA
ncbi:ABC transporter permease [Terribacillus sp. 179-K 1B1 HS]|uniref:ABC transporter permease n=1 Tax=Terribacillus sp. 179-K 1B1 HS TaxID=3142388 RepID=UPI0039A2E3D4